MQIGFSSGEDADPYHRQLFGPVPLDDDFKALALRVFQPLWGALDGDKA